MQRRKNENTIKVSNKKQPPITEQKWRTLDTEKFIWLMSIENKNVLKELVKMIKILTNQRNTLLMG